MTGRFPVAEPRSAVRNGARFAEHGDVDALLLSAYLDHRPSVEALSAIASELGVPVVLGGPMFAVPEVAAAWRDVPGLTVLFGGEADGVLAGLVRAVVAGEDPAGLPGVMLPDGSGRPAPPLRDLTSLPVPDLSDFPWHLYPRRIVPLMTSRGCGWGRCLFCSDVITSNGRGFRSRPPEAVLAEMQEQARRHDTRDFHFLDIKLNSDLEMWRALIEQTPSRVPGARWLGTVHVQARGDNGLSREELRQARAAGMQRISFGLETGSQRINDRMAKGTKVERMGTFIDDAAAAGLSVRTSMMVGFPGETAADVAETVGFVRRHEDRLDRIALARFKAIPGTGFAERFDDRPARYPDLRGVRWDHRGARAWYYNAATTGRAYRRAKRELLELVHRINRRPLRAGAFDGVM
jgi:anaerobic magnesium-protoporphyrin IX monomethyl ester cyclase